MQSANKAVYMTDSTLQNNIYSAVKPRVQAASNGFRSPLVGSQLINNRQADSQSDFQPFSQNSIELGPPGQRETGYVPEAHTGKARSI